MAIETITIEPALRDWIDLLRDKPDGRWRGQSLERWRETTRRELGLPVDQPILATGHQPTFWHPGILAKYLAVNVVMRSRAGMSARISSMNIVVDQDVVECSRIDVPARSADGLLISRSIDLHQGLWPEGVPVGLLPAFTPTQPSITALPELPQLPEAINRVAASLAAHADAASAAVQVASALAKLMTECCGIEPMPTITASALMRTSLARSLLEEMARDPHRCAESYNRAVAEHPESRLTTLTIRDDYVELPLWRVRAGDVPRRIRAFDADVEGWLDAAGVSPRTVLLPRAMLMTAIIRMAAADLFVHGRGGALYDRAMERWIGDWLGLAVSPMAMVSADVRLQLMRADDVAALRDGGLERARRRLRVLRHDPDSVNAPTQSRPSTEKQRHLTRINALPRRSPERRAAFLAMHAQLQATRGAHPDEWTAAMKNIERLERIEHDARVALRRDWAFAIYPREMLRELRDRIGSQL